MDNKEKNELEKEVERLQEFILLRFNKHELLRLDKFIADIGLNQRYALFGSMLLDGRDKTKIQQVIFNPFRTLFVKLFFEKAQCENSFYTIDNKQIFNRLQQAFVIYRLGQVKDLVALVEFRERLEEAFYKFEDSFVDADFLIEVDDLIDDLKGLQVND